ncbi:MAG: hypothetical protein WAN93_11935 [Solirubrobacteraceae bacterium]
MPSLLAVGFLAFGCCGCESTAQRSAALEKQAKHEKLALRGVSVASENPSVKVLQSTVVHSNEGTAVVVSLRNDSSHPLRDAPIEITVRDAKGSVLFQNNQPGEDPSLTHVSLLAPGAQTIWVDDQVQVGGIPSSAKALVGEAKQVTGKVPQMSVSITHSRSEAGEEAGAAGTVTNRSSVTQQHLVVYAVARKSGEIVAAGRAVLPEVAPRMSAPFQIYLVGDPSGAQIQMSAPATTS